MYANSRLVPEYRDGGPGTIRETSECESNLQTNENNRYVNFNYEKITPKNSERHMETTKDDRMFKGLYESLKQRRRMKWGCKLESEFLILFGHLFGREPGSCQTNRISSHWPKVDSRMSALGYQSNNAHVWVSETSRTSRGSPTGATGTHVIK